jgi:hypothetical protein
MKKLFIVLTLVLGACLIGHAQNKDSILLSIDFQDFFINDTVDLRINNVSIFEKKVLTSDKSTGFTDLVITINFLKKKVANVHYLNSNINIKLKTKITLDIYLNGNKNHFEIDENCGKYIGLSKRDSNQFYLVQRSKPFIYD